MKALDYDKIDGLLGLEYNGEEIDTFQALEKQVIQAIPLSKVKQAKLEVEDIRELTKDGWKSPRELKEEFIEILDKLIESEVENG